MVRQWSSYHSPRTWNHWSLSSLFEINSQIDPMLWHKCAAQITAYYSTYLPEEQLTFTHLNLSHPLSTPRYVSVISSLSVFWENFGLQYIFVYNMTQSERCFSLVMNSRRSQLQKQPADDAYRAHEELKSFWETENITPLRPDELLLLQQANLDINKALTWDK